MYILPAVDAVLVFEFSSSFFAAVKAQQIVFRPENKCLYDYLKKEKTAIDTNLNKEQFILTCMQNQQVLIVIAWEYG